MTLRKNDFQNIAKIIIFSVILYLLFFGFNDKLNFANAYKSIFLINVVMTIVGKLTWKKTMINKEKNNIIKKEISNFLESGFYLNDPNTLIKYKDNDIRYYYLENKLDDKSTHLNYLIDNLQRESKTLYKIYLSYVPNNDRVMIGSYEVFYEFNGIKSAYIIINEYFIDQLSDDKIQSIYKEINDVFTKIDKKVEDNIEYIEENINKKQEKNNIISDIINEIYYFLKSLLRTSINIFLYYTLYELGYGRYIIILILFRIALIKFKNKQKRKD